MTVGLQVVHTPEGRVCLEWRGGGHVVSRDVTGAWTAETFLERFAAIQDEALAELARLRGDTSPREGWAGGDVVTPEPPAGWSDPTHVRSVVPGAYLGALLPCVACKHSFSKPDGPGGPHCRLAKPERCRPWLYSELWEAQGPATERGTLQAGEPAAGDA